MTPLDANECVDANECDFDYLPHWHGAGKTQFQAADERR
jgi:hypothetical protein